MLLFPKELICRNSLAKLIIKFYTIQFKLNNRVKLKHLMFLFNFYMVIDKLSKNLIGNMGIYLNRSTENFKLYLPNDIILVYLLIMLNFNDTLKLILLNKSIWELLNNSRYTVLKVNTPRLCLNNADQNFEVELLYRFKI